MRSSVTSMCMAFTITGMTVHDRRNTQWYDHWQQEGQIPDYSHLSDRLRTLADQGHADAVLELGAKLWTKGTAQVEEAHDEGETAMAIAECLETVTQALPETSLTPVEQLLWLLDHLLEDEFGLLDSSDTFLDHPSYTQGHWQEVADTLEARLNARSKARNPDFHASYHRDRLLRQLLNAYRRGGWQVRIIPRLESEVDACQCHTRLVDELLAAGQGERARHWCIQGYARTRENAPGIAGQLQDRLRAMAESEQRHDFVAAYRAQDFFHHPSTAKYEDLRSTAEKAECWPEVRNAVLRYLETGQIAGPGTSDETKTAWPLPSPEVGSLTGKKQPGHGQFPDLSTLIGIAILEKRPDDVVVLHRALSTQERRNQGIDKDVAEAVAGTHADVALAIWKDIAEELIARVKPSAYVEAATYLRLMKKVYARDKRQSEWLALLQNIRTRHKAKRRLMEVLDGFSDRKIIE